MAFCLAHLGVLDGEASFFDCVRIISFFEVGSRSWFHLDWLQRSKWQAEPIQVIINVDLSSWNSAQSWLIDVLFAFWNLWDWVEVSLDGVRSGAWLLVLLFFWWGVRVV